MNFRHLVIETSLTAGTRGLTLATLQTILQDAGDPDPLTTVDQALDDGTLVPNATTDRLIHTRFVGWGGCKGRSCRL